MAICQGTEPDHCCWVAGRPCTQLRDDGPTADRRWVCTLMEELGDWDLVHVDARYQADPKPTWDELGVTDCGAWPGPNDVPCPDCGLAYETPIDL